ncbi:hypothetical protein A7325_08600 [Psychrobacter sp. SHUES1]|nr:hypothetical protein A7325_08600 [Psychrobacter sp. SHUES1]
MENVVTIIFVLLVILAVIGAIWHWILMWRYSKALFLSSIFIPLIPTVYFYFKCWKDKNVKKAFYLQVPAMLSIFILIIFVGLQP